MLPELNSTFKIGSLELSNRLIQAPLAGISCAAFRELFSLYYKPAYAVSEMISANSILEQRNLGKRYLHRSNNEGLWCIQLSGNEPQNLAKAVKICQKYNPDLIDLNCGCPKPKIRTKGCGSALIENPEQLKNIVSAMRDATDIPLTVKIRTAGRTNDEKYLQAATNIATAGADALIVHGRHHSENYDVPANYKQIKRITQEISIPVIANGDINSKGSAQFALQKSGASALMIGRGSIGRPWIFQDILGGDVAPSTIERIEIFQYHIKNLAKLENNEIKAIMQARRLLKWYFPEIDSKELSIYYDTTCLKELIAKLKVAPQIIIQRSGATKESQQKEHFKVGLT